MKFFRSMRLIARHLLICFVAMNMFSGVVYTQSKQIYVETQLLYNFETVDEWIPISNASRFMVTGAATNDNGVEVTYPSIRLFPVKPYGLGNLSVKSTNSLGVSVLFNRRAYNFFDLVPTTQKWIPGKTQSLDVWVWGGNFDYRMEIILENRKGYSLTYDLGSLTYLGWRNLSVRIPTSALQFQSYVPSQEGLKFLNFRFWSSPETKTDSFTVLLDYFQAVTDTYRENYDGSDVEIMLIEEQGMQTTGNGTGNNTVDVEN